MLTYSTAVPVTLYHTFIYIQSHIQQEKHDRCCRYCYVIEGYSNLVIFGMSGLSVVRLFTRVNCSLCEPVKFIIHKVKQKVS